MKSSAPNQGRFSRAVLIEARRIAVKSMITDPTEAVRLACGAQFLFVVGLPKKSDKEQLLLALKDVSAGRIRMPLE